LRKTTPGVVIGGVVIGSGGIGRFKCGSSLDT
jgi:hypothetical protein